MADTPKKENARVPGWIWLITGALLGALIMFLMRLSELRPEPARPGAQSNRAAEESNNSTEFSFYDLLRMTEVDVKKSPDKPATSQPDNVQQLLQVASFSSLADAEQVRAELILLNLNARVEAAQVASGATWHRVMVGPFESRSQLAKARDTLLSNRYEAMRVQRPLDPKSSP